MIEMNWMLHDRNELEVTCMYTSFIEKRFNNGKTQNSSRNKKATQIKSTKLPLVMV